MTTEIALFLANDPNANILIVSGAFSIPLWRSGRPFSEIRAEAAQLQKIEAEFIALLREPETKARVRVWNLADFVEDPVEPLRQIVDELNPRADQRQVALPQMVDLSGFAQFIQNLRNQGMQPVLMGDFPAELDMDAINMALSRPREAR